MDEEKVLSAEETAEAPETVQAQEEPAQEAVPAPAEETAPAAEESPAAQDSPAQSEASAEPAPSVSSAPEAEPAEEAPQPESMADYEDAINASMRKIHEGDILTGTVIGITDEELTIDLGYYTDGVIRLEDASDDPSFTFKDIQMNQSISATVIRRDNNQGRIQLSMKAAAAELGWDRLVQLEKEQSNISVKVSEAVKSGVVAYVEGIRGFIPASKLSLTYVEDLTEFVGKEIEVRVITADPENKKLVLSARDILREREAEERKARISNVEIGLVTEGTVETIKPYGAFIDLGKGLSGLVHVSQISTQRIKDPSVVLKVGQKVKVKIIAVKDGKISLSMKALEDVAATEIEEETYRLPKAEEATTSLASLFKNIKL